MKRFAIIGAGLAGHSAAQELARIEPEATVTLIGAEAGLPYDRPPLSKNMLLGEYRDGPPLLPNAERYTDAGIVYHPATLATGIDRHGRLVHTDSTAPIPFDALLIATGSRVRRLPDEACSDVPVHVLRTAADATALREALDPGVRLAVIGGGLIGLEVAAAARKIGCAVTVIEAASRLLSRGLPPQVGAWAAALHSRKGVTFLLGATVERLQRTRDGIVIHSGGPIAEADVVLSAIGVEPNVELAAAAGLAVEDGIVVDEACRTSDRAIFAAGEVTMHPCVLVGERRRVESWRTAMEQGISAARCMAGQGGHFDDPAWLWSDQYDVNLQSLGFPDEGSDRLVLGNMTGDKWTLISRAADGRLVGAVAVNGGRHIAMLRRAVTSGQPIPPALLADAVPIDDAGLGALQRENVL